MGASSRQRRHAAFNVGFHDLPESVTRSGEGSFSVHSETSPPGRTACRSPTGISCPVSGGRERCRRVPSCPSCNSTKPNVLSPGCAAQTAPRCPRLCDPVGDRVVEVLRVASEVGGEDSGHAAFAVAVPERGRVDSLRARVRQPWTVSGRDSRSRRRGDGAGPSPGRALHRTKCGLAEEQVAAYFAGFEVPTTDEGPLQVIRYEPADTE